MAATETIGAARAVAFWTGLRPSERQVGAAMAEGWTNAEIAKRLSFSPRTVEKRVQTIYDQLPDFPGSHRRVHAVLLIRSVLEYGPLAGCSEPGRAASAERGGGEAS